LLIDSDCATAFASFTFDVDEPGSVVVIPEGIDTEGWSDPVVDDTIPDGILLDDTHEMWRAAVEKALGDIDSGEIEKVVLSRRIRARMSHPIDPYAIAQQLEKRQARSHVFLIEGLVGASPELLLRFDQGQVTSIPLAGSADGGGQLLDSPKVAVEHKLAADSVRDALTRAGVAFIRGQPEAADFEDLRHLATHFSGTAPEDATFADVLRELHPTAAVAGTPRDRAMASIRDLETSPRGRYSGPVGWFDRHGNGEFAIALRCGLITGTTVELRSGAGIVSGSDPDAELEETNWKFAPMLDALGLSIQV
jgi:menaquinone-specific isochorismate synthase